MGYQLSTIVNSICPDADNFFSFGKRQQNARVCTPTCYTKTGLGTTHVQPSPPRQKRTFHLFMWRRGKERRRRVSGLAHRLFRARLPYTAKARYKKPIFSKRMLSFPQKCSVIERVDRDCILFSVKKTIVNWRILVL